MNGLGVSLLQPLIANPMPPLFHPHSRAGFANCRVAFRPTLSALAAPPILAHNHWRCIVAG